MLHSTRGAARKPGRAPRQTRAAAAVQAAREAGEQRATTPLRPALLPPLVALIPSLGFPSSAGTWGLPQDTRLLWKASFLINWHGWGHGAEAGGPPGYAQAHGASGVWFPFLPAFLGILPSESGGSAEV